MKNTLFNRRPRHPSEHSHPGPGPAGAPWYEHGAAFLSYAAAAATVTWPVILHLRTMTVTRLLEVTDAGDLIWFYWLVKDSILHGHSFFHTDYAFYPVGRDLVLQLGNYLEALISIPFQLTLGFPAFYNVMILLFLSLNGYCAWLLVREMTGRSVAAWPLGLAYAITPYMAQEVYLGQTPQIMIFWFPLYALWLWRLMKNHRPGDAFLAGTVLALTCATYWYYGFFLVFLTILVLPLGLWRTGAAKGEWKACLPGLVSFLVVVAPFAYYFVAYYIFHHNFPGVSAGAPLAATTLENSPDLNYPLMMFPLLVNLAILPLVGLKRRQVPWEWLLALVVFYAWSLGPYLQWNGNLVNLGGRPVAGFFLWAYRHLPMFSRFRWPDRLFPVVTLILVVLAGFALAGVLKRLPAGLRWGAPISLLLAALLMAQGLIPFRGNDLRSFPWPNDQAPVAPPFYHWLAGQPPGVVIEFPLWHARGSNLFQMVHHHKMLGGIREGDQIDPAYGDLIGGNSFFRYLESLFPFQGTPKGVPFREADLRRLEELGFRYLILQKRNCARKPPIRVGMPVSPLDRMDYIWIKAELTRTLGPPMFADEYLCVFLLQSGAGREAKT